MPKKNKKRAGAKPNKSAFVRSLAFDMPSADVISRAKAQGMTLTRNDVHAIRAIARRKTEPARASSAGRTNAAGINKSAFVRSLPGSLSAADVIARGKAKGIRLSAAQIYTIRANARRKGDVKSGPRAAPRARSTGLRAQVGRAGGSRETEFVTAVLDLGLTKAEALIHALRAKAINALS
jgi:hypothetical protein